MPLGRFPRRGDGKVKVEEPTTLFERSSATTIATVTLVLCHSDAHAMISSDDLLMAPSCMKDLNVRSLLGGTSLGRSCHHTHTGLQLGMQPSGTGAEPQLFQISILFQHHQIQHHDNSGRLLLHHFVPSEPPKRCSLENGSWAG